MRVEALFITNRPFENGNSEMFQANLCVPWCGSGRYAPPFIYVKSQVLIMIETFSCFVTFCRQATPDVFFLSFSVWNKTPKMIFPPSAGTWTE